MGDGEQLYWVGVRGEGVGFLGDEGSSSTGPDAGSRVSVFAAGVRAYNRTTHMVIAESGLTEIGGNVRHDWTLGDRRLEGCQGRAQVRVKLQRRWRDNGQGYIGRDKI